ncbi:MAG: nitroreductase family protein [Deltaproteobacteria bacterium]|nr:nitroreductase family protein [Deltaproteobacteria bacterium]
MSAFMELIKGRRSIRKFKDRDLTEEQLRQILDAVRWSPSWANTQCWEIIVVRDPGVKAELHEAIPKTNPAGKGFPGAPAILVICGKLNSSGYYKGEVTTKFGDWFMFDLGLASQSICLAAYEQGLGTVIIGLFDHDAAKRVLNVPEGYELVAMVPVGVPAQESKAPKRREIEEFVHMDRF